jgi:hypothetical protein
LQQRLAGDIGVAWSDFALISPDIWRKQLLDYASLGAAYKYGGACTSEELRIIDQKLDRYMARKAERQATTHLLIDRFRFDSFAPESAEAGSNLLTRFGHTVYLFFMITPPESLVERAWKRGLEVGRYKAVDDVLAHNIEAYTGMPEIFFTWALRADKQVHCEFLDNTVPFGTRPRTIAFGWNGELNVHDVHAMLNLQSARAGCRCSTSRTRRRAGSICGWRRANRHGLIAMRWMRRWPIPPPERACWPSRRPSRKERFRHTTSPRISPRSLARNAFTLWGAGEPRRSKA